MKFAERMEGLSTEIGQLRDQSVEGRNVSAHLSTTGRSVWTVWRYRQTRSSFKAWQYPYDFDCFDDDDDDDDDDDFDHDGNDDDGNDCSVKRSSKDTIINNFGRSLLDFCFLFDLMIVNGACSMDTDGEFTFVSPNGSSVVDYFLACRNVLEKWLREKKRMTLLCHQ